MLGMNIMAFDQFDIEKSIGYKHLLWILENLGIY
jgi:hypothetical protein